MTYTYILFEMVIQLTFPCPMLAPAPDGASPDVIMTEDDVPMELAQAVTTGENWQASPGRFLWRGGMRAGRFLVEDGRMITLQRNPAVEEPMLVAHLLTGVLAALLRQRGLLVLHANTAVTSRGAVTVTGETGAGKSTTLAALLSCGCAMLADDITVLRLGANGQVEVLPGIPKLNLCEDAAGRLGHDIDILPRNLLRLVKVVVPTHEAMVSGPTRLYALYLLSKSLVENVKLTALNGSDKFAALQECIYGPLFSEEHPGQFGLFAAICNQVEMFRLERPESRWSADEVAELIAHG
jgi:hypothetical protein